MARFRVISTRKACSYTIHDHQTNEGVAQVNTRDDPDLADDICAYLNAREQCRDTWRSIRRFINTPQPADKAECQEGETAD